MTEKEFEEKIKQGEKLLILDDLVIDVSTSGYLEAMHPGGAFLIKQCIGRDVSKFFHGGHALDHNSNDPKAQTPRHTHSNIAIAHANGMAIAVLSRKKAANCIGFIDHNKTEKVNQHTSTITFKLMPPKDSAQGLQDTMQIKHYYDDFEYFGKHYMVSACKDEFGSADVQGAFDLAKVRRHYTIANCMRKTFYSRLLKASENFLNDQSVSSAIEAKHLDELANDDSKELSLTIKNYNVPHGISKQFYETSLANQAYEIKGPMGKGLGITAESQGNHMCFAAGTGILVFVDLIARLILSTLEVIPEQQRVHPQFKLRLYASFMSRDEAVALDLLEALDKIQKKKGLEQFTLILRLSKTDDPSAVKPPRWDENYLDSEIQKAKSVSAINKIWACGPPLMDEQFEKILVDLTPKYEIDFKTQVDIM